MEVKGFESHFVKSWGVREQLDTLAVCFYNSELQDEFAVDLDHNECYDVFLLLDHHLVEIYKLESGDEKPIATYTIESVKTENKESE